MKLHVVFFSRVKSGDKPFITSRALHIFRPFHSYFDFEFDFVARAYRIAFSRDVDFYFAVRNVEMSMMPERKSPAEYY